MHTAYSTNLWLLVQSAEIASWEKALEMLEGIGFPEKPVINVDENRLKDYLTTIKQRKGAGV